jgi:hypothetical protein
VAGSAVLRPGIAQPHNEMPGSHARGLRLAPQ